LGLASGGIAETAGLKVFAAVFFLVRQLAQQ